MAPIWWRVATGEGTRQHFRIVGRDGGYTAQVADVTIVIRPLIPQMSAHSEAFQVSWASVGFSSRLKVAETNGKHEVVRRAVF
jgi:hypothetical protein